MLYMFDWVTTFVIGKWFSREENGTFSKLPPENVMKCCGINLYMTPRLLIRKLPMNFWGAFELQYKKNSHHHNEFLGLHFQVNPQRTQFFLNFVSVFPQLWQIFLNIFIFSSKMNLSKILQYICPKCVFCEMYLICLTFKLRKF